MPYKFKNDNSITDLKLARTYKLYRSNCSETPCISVVLCVRAHESCVHVYILATAPGEAVFESRAQTKGTIISLYHGSI